MTEHIPERGWRARAGDRLLNLLSRKFLLAIGAMIAICVLATQLEDAAILGVAVGGIVAAAGVQAGADAAITRETVRRGVGP